MAQLIVIIALFALLWVLLIRPQRARQSQHQKMLTTVEPGDEVLTVGGLYGIVQSIDEEGDLIVEIADGIHVRIARRGVATIVKPDDDEHDHDEEDDSRAELDGAEPGIEEQPTEEEQPAKDEQPARA